MKKTLLLLIAIVALILPKKVQAQAVSNLLDTLSGATNFTGGGNFLTEIISLALPIVLVFGGMMLLAMIIQGGYALLSSPNDPEGQAKGKARITWAVIGFLLLFSAFWIVQILESIFLLNITGGSAGLANGGSTGGGGSTAAGSTTAPGTSGGGGDVCAGVTCGACQTCVGGFCQGPAVCPPAAGGGAGDGGGAGGGPVVTCGDVACDNGDGTCSCISGLTDCDDPVYGVCCSNEWGGACARDCNGDVCTNPNGSCSCLNPDITQCFSAVAGYCCDGSFSATACVVEAPTEVVYDNNAPIPVDETASIYDPSPMTVNRESCNADTCANLHFPLPDHLCLEGYVNDGANDVCGVFCVHPNNLAASYRPCDYTP